VRREVFAVQRFVLVEGHESWLTLALFRTEQMAKQHEEALGGTSSMYRTRRAWVYDTFPSDGNVTLTD